MFEDQYRFYGKHADMVKELKSVFDEKTNARIFNSYIELLLVAPLVGFVYKRKVERDRSEGASSNTESIFPKELITRQQALEYNVKLILLLDKKYEPDETKRIDKAFRFFGNSTEDFELFQSYVRGGVEVLYEKIIEDSSGPDDYVNKISDLLEDFEQLYNGGVTNEIILEKCREVEKKSEWITDARHILLVYRFFVI